MAVYGAAVAVGLLLAWGGRSYASGPVISEFVASNDSGLRDEDGDHSDWIELYNPDATNIDLTGWYLTDEADEPDKWRFPATSLPPGGFLIVFASDKNRRTVGGELHTNFKLSADGEYLALVAPDETTVVYAFAPQFPPQLKDVSYGITFEQTPLLESGDSVAWRVPTAADAAAAWDAVSYDDAAWPRAPQGMGFSNGGGAFDVTLVRSSIAVGSLTTAESVLATPANQLSVVTEQAAVINYLNTSGIGMYDNDATFPGLTIGSDVNDFVVEATARVLIPEAGPWTFGVNSDDGFGLTLTNKTETFSIQFPGTRGAGTTLGVFNIPAAGAYDLRLVYFERGGGSEVECFAAQGSRSAFDAAVFHLVGDQAGGGLALAGLQTLIATDVAADMRGVNATLWTRAFPYVRFPEIFETVALRLWYADGVMARFNGVTVAELNAPTPTAWDSTATTNRPLDVALQPIDIALPAAALQSGTNLLAVQGMNDSASDGDFVLAYTLTGARAGTAHAYFATPTPGGINPVSGELGRVPEVAFSVEHCVTNAAFMLELTCKAPEATIRYTTDASTPTATRGQLYTGPFAISGTSVIRARAFETGHEPSYTATRTYLFPVDVVRQSPNGEVPGATWPSASVNGQVFDYGMDPDIVDSTAYGDLVVPALSAIPSISLVTDAGNLFDATTGIYVNASQDGAAWERPASVELIAPAGDAEAGFQINAGLRIRGGYSRSSGNPKHAFRLLFREQYGEAKLHYPLFRDEGADTFDCVDLRTAQNYSWSFGGDSRNTLCREVWNRDTQRDMGRPYTRSRYYHVYINGEYWGIYETQERAEASFGESYLGGDEDDYDVVKVDASAGYTIYATDGTLDAWHTLWQMATNGFAANADYYRAQGLNPDGTRNAAYPKLLDVDNLIDLMIAVYYAGDLDGPISNFLSNDRPNNMYAMYNRVEPDGFKFFRHDAEHTMLNNNQDRTGPWNGGSQFQYFNPQWLHQQLTANADYTMRFADAVQRHCFNDGVLTPAAAQERLRARMRQIDLAIVAESARWGDAKHTPAYTQGDWSNACNWVLNTHMPVRTDILISQFRNQGWFPETTAPTLSRNGGIVDSGEEIYAAADEGTIYFTLDGSDPRLPEGGISPTAIAYTPVGTTTIVAVPAGATWKYLDDGSDAGTAWREPAFDDGAWAAGPAELGYGDGGEATVVSYGPSASRKYITTYFRHTFTVSSLAGVTSAELELVRDDGAVVYLNGTEIVRANMPAGTITSTTPAAGTASGTDESSFQTYTVDLAALRAGDNVLAVEVHQVNALSSDISFNLRLRLTARTSSTPIVLTASGTLRTRAYSSGTWSALTEAFFAVGSAPEQLRVTELMYHPLPPPAESPFDADAFEFVELENIGDAPIDLARVRFVAGIQCVMTNCLLQPGERAVVVANPEAFAQRYDTNGVRIAGVYSGQLANDGEPLRLQDPFATDVLDFRYDDRWWAATDGDGYSLVIADPNAAVDSWGDSNAWHCGTVLNGTPGWDEPALAAGTILVNELLTHTDAETDWLELYNAGTNDVALGGWLLSDQANHLGKFQIPAGSVLRAGEYLTFDAASDFDCLTNAGCRTPFAFSELGESAFVASGQGGIPTSYRAGVSFGAADREVTFGRYRRSDGVVDFVPLAYPTRGASNAPPLVGPVVIHELMYHPPPDGCEFIELKNVSDAPVPLYDPAVPSNTWHFTDGIVYDFPQGLVMPPGGFIVLTPVAPAVFRAMYGVPDTVPVLGPYAGALADEGECLALARPGDPELDGFVPYYRVDRVTYNDKPPWPVAADGDGFALQRAPADAYGNDPASWTTSAVIDGSPGEETARVPRRWLIGYGWTNAPGETETWDTDGDGLAAWCEYDAGTVPTNASSTLRLSLGPDATGAGFVLGWDVVSGRLYRVWQSASPGGDATIVPAGSLAAQSNAPVRLDLPVTPGPAFYRVGVRRP